jgi:hypothetical protein
MRYPISSWNRSGYGTHRSRFAQAANRRAPRALRERLMRLSPVLDFCGAAVDSARDLLLR